MNYTFKEGNKKDLNDFSFNSPKGHIFQTSYWGDFKGDWINKCILGFDHDNNVVLSSIILIRKLPILNKYMAYIPRGFVCDYNNITLISEFTEFLKEFSKEHKIAFITIDPDIHLKENECEVKENISTIETLKSLGFIQNSSKNFENIQPNFVFRLNLPKNTSISNNEKKKNILKHFSSKARYNIKLSSERGLSVSKYNFDDLTEDKIEIFQNLMDITGKRDNFIVRKKEYFYDMLKTLNPYCRLYLVKYSYEKDKNNIYKKMDNAKLNLDKLRVKSLSLDEKLKEEKDEKKLAKLKDKLESLSKEINNYENQLDSLEKKLLTISGYKNKENLYISGAIYLYYGNKAWYLYGASHNILRDTMPNFIMQYEMIKDSIDNNCDIYDFRGVSGDLSESNPLYGLYRFKKMFNGDFVEFIGEYTLVTNKYIYTIFKKLFPKFKDVRNALLNKKK